MTSSWRYRAFRVYVSDPTYPILFFSVPDLYVATRHDLCPTGPMMRCGDTSLLASAYWTDI